MPGLRVVQPHAVDQHEHLTEGRPAKGEVGLHAADSALARTSTDDVSRSTSAMLWTGSASICCRVITFNVRVTLPSSTGLAAAVTTTV